MKIIIILYCLLWTNPFQAQILDSLSLVDIPPLFEGCDDPLISEAQRQACSIPKIQSFVNQNIVYPDSAKARKVEGLVVVRFVITEKGEITSLELLRDIGSGCGSEALRVVRMMPNFRPALRAGEPVATKMILPIRFKKMDIAEGNNDNLYQIHWGATYVDLVNKNELQRLIQQHLVLRDYYGQVYEVKFLTLKLKNKNKEKIFESKGNILSKEMIKALEKARYPQVVNFEAVIEKDYKEINVSRKIRIEK